MPDGTLHVQGPDGKHYAFGPSSGVTDEASARAYFQKNGLLPSPTPQATPQPPMAQMSATDTSNPLANWFKDVRGDLLYGGKETLPGRVATWLNPRGMAAVPGSQFLGGMALGPTHIGEGVAELPQHPVHGAAEIVRGVGQTAALPAAVLAPETTALAAPRMAAGTAASELSSRLGASPDVSTLIGAGASMAPPWRSGKPQAALSAAERTRYREVIHEGLQRNIADPAKAKIQDAIGASRNAAKIQVAGDAHPVNQLLNAKTGKDFIETLRGGPDGENALAVKDALKELGIDTKFRDQVLADAKEPYNFIIAKGPGRNFAGKFQAILSRPGWAIPGAAIGAAAGHAIGMPFIGGGVGAIAGAGVGERLQGLRLAREAKAGLMDQPSPAAAPATPATPSGPAATANELMRLRNPELFGQPAGDAAARAQRIEEILKAAQQSETQPQPATAPIAPVAAATPKPVSGGASPAPAIQEKPAEPVPSAQTPAAKAEQISSVQQYASPRQRSNLAKNQRQMAGFQASTAPAPEPSPPGKPFSLASMKNYASATGASPAAKAATIQGLKRPPIEESLTGMASPRKAELIGLQRELKAATDPKERADIQQAIDYLTSSLEGRSFSPPQQAEVENLPLKQPRTYQPELAPREGPVRGLSPNNPLTAQEINPKDAGYIRTGDLAIDPKRFQYKATGDEGVTNLLKDVRTFDPQKAGVVQIWRDPESGQLYVVNGHHRFQLAKRTGQPSILVQHIDAASAGEARAIGALTNIAEGRGTALDAAKFFRDSGMTPAALEKQGLSMGESQVADGLALSKLDPSIFDKVATGKLPESHGIAIGNATADGAQQQGIVDLIRRAEAKGKSLSTGTVAELARNVVNTSSRVENTMDLFGAQSRVMSNAVEKAEISAYIKQQLAREKRTFGAVATEGRAKMLGGVEGQTIQAAKNLQISQQAAQALEAFDKLSSYKGPVDEILENAAKEYASGSSKPEAVKSKAYEGVRAELQKTLTARSETGSR